MNAFTRTVILPIKLSEIQKYFECSLYRTAKYLKV